MLPQTSFTAFGPVVQLEALVQTAQPSEASMSWLRKWWTLSKKAFLADDTLGLRPFPPRLLEMPSAVAWHHIWNALTECGGLFIRQTLLSEGFTTALLGAGLNSSIAVCRNVKERDRNGGQNFIRLRLISWLEAVKGTSQWFQAVLTAISCLQ